MYIPRINKEDIYSDGSFFSFKCNELVKAYLFDGLTFRELDFNILHVDGNISRGLISNNFIKKYLGLDTEFKGLFKDMSIEDAIDELKSTSDDSYNELINILENILCLTKNDFMDRLAVGENILFYGVPGCGKSWTIKNKVCNGVDENHMERIVFHPDYTYSDFVGQILPKVYEDQVKYEFIPGPFTSILKKAYEKPNEHFFLIIEEINRGNAPAIFGDIFQLLDRMEDDQDGFKKGTSEFPITNSDIASKVDGCANDKVRIPSNLSIIATMNTSDQNVFTLDTAFQRRWNMVMIENEIDDEENHLFEETNILDTELTWKQFCYGINKKILENNNNLSSSEDKRLGTYFIKPHDFEYDDNQDDEYKNLLKTQSRKFSEKVLKYLWDDAFKFSRDEIFNEEKYNSLDSIIKEFNVQTGKERFNVFKKGLYDELINIDFSIDDEKGEQ